MVWLAAGTLGGRLRKYILTEDVPTTIAHAGPSQLLTTSRVLFIPTVLTIQEHGSPSTARGCPRLMSPRVWTFGYGFGTPLGLDSAIRVPAAIFE